MNRKCTKDNKLLVCLLVIVMALSMVGGGLLVNWCSAIDEEQTTEPSTKMVEEIVEPTKVETTEVVTEPTTTEEKAEQSTSLSHEEIILRDTDLSTIDFIKLIDKSKSYEWYAYYIHSDGDIYVVTIRNNRVDVCCILN